MKTLVQKIFHLICVKNYRRDKNRTDTSFQEGFKETKIFFSRFGDKINFRGKKVMDVGCGLGSTCIYLAINGAEEVVGIDINKHSIEFAKSKLIRDYPQLSNIVKFKMVEELGNENFDVIISKDSFEHIKNPTECLIDMKKRLTKNGLIAIGFGPLWKSPYGGHISFMTKFPWSHLIFPESVIMEERKRFRPEERAETFEEIIGGLNKMTLNKFLDIIKNSSLEAVYFKTNVSENRIVKTFNILRYLPLCKEFFTCNIYCILKNKA